MNRSKKFFVTILCVFTMIFGVFGLTSCDALDRFLDEPSAGGGGWWEEPSWEEPSWEEPSWEESSSEEPNDCEHSFSGWLVTTEPKCNQEGIETRSCLYCGEEQTRSLGFVDHVSDDEATCITQKVCDVCGTSFGAYNAAAHEGEIVWMKTANTHQQVYSCCGLLETEEEEHVKVNGTCKTCGFNPTIRMSNVTAMAGEEQVVVVISIEDNPGMLGLELTVTYDENVMTLTDAQNGNAMGAMDFTLPSTLASGSKFLWDSLGSATRNGEMLILTFNIKENVPQGDHSILMKVKGYDSNVELITFKLVNGTITVGE